MSDKDMWEGAEVAEIMEYHVHWDSKVIRGVVRTRVHELALMIT